MESSTKILRRMLDERGVEWKAWDGTHPITVWHDETYLYEFIEYRLVNGAKQVNGCPSDNDGHCELTIKVFNCTPEQAIAATVGSDKVEAVLRKLIARLGVAADFHFARKYVDCIVEEYAGKLATLGTGTCKLTMDGTDGCFGCSECLENIPPLANYCPNCGRRIEQ